MQQNKERLFALQREAARGQQQRCGVHTPRYAAAVAAAVSTAFVAVSAAAPAVVAPAAAAAKAAAAAATAFRWD